MLADIGSTLDLLIDAIENELMSILYGMQISLYLALSTHDAHVDTFGGKPNNFYCGGCLTTMAKPSAGKAQDAGATTDKTCCSQ